MSDRLYRTTDGEIVPEGDPRAAFLVVGAGGAVPPEWARAVDEYRASTEVPRAETPKPRRRSKKRAAPKPAAE